MHKLALSMIVKNENVEHFYECLDSISPHIDYWVICDNGSTDGTQEYIKNYFKEKGIPGELHEVEWVNFGHNRTEALTLCDGKADYIVMIDADDKVVGDLKIPDKLDLDGYAFRIKRGDFTWWRNQVFKSGIGWSYIGAVHEYAACQSKMEGGSFTSGRIEGNYYVDARTLGTERNKNADGTDVTAEQKYSRDAELLEKEIVKEPDNTRYHFYLAQSYFDSKQFEKAEQAYAHRASMGGWREEVFYSIFRTGICKMMLGKPWPDAQDTFLQAWNIKPDRAEPLYHLSRVHRDNGNNHLAYLFAKSALEIPYPEGDILFINDDMYKWMVLDEYASTAFYVGDFEKGYKACETLIRMVDNGEISKEHRERFVTNLEHYKSSLQGLRREDMDKIKIIKDKKKKKEVDRKKAVKNQENLKKKRKKRKVKS
jgi:glycosyltransferase involved in cell wall biosynthesis